MKATFFERLGAYLVDAIIVSLIFSLICFGIGEKTGNEERLLEQLDEQLLQSEITLEEYVDEYSEIIYDVQKDRVLQTGISVALTIAYFVVFQYMNKGQTLGKKLLKLKVVDKNNEKPISILKGAIRSVFPLSILSGLLSVILLYITNKDGYMVGYLSVVGIELLFTLVTIIMILYKKDKRGLHDLMANTVVIKESR